MTLSAATGNRSAMTRPFLILQLRPETEAADDEFAAILRMSGLLPARARRIRLDRENLPEDLNLDDHAGVIVGGGPGCVSDAPDRKSPVEARIEAQILGLMPAITGADRPFLGCCYGIGILGAHLGAEVSKRAHGEPVGTADCRLTEAGAADPLLAGLPPRFDAFVGHKEALQSLPDGCAHLVAAPTCPFQMVRFGRNVYATQFHPEADAAGFETRIRIYRHKGYFAPEEADSLIAMCRAARVEAPARILRNFVTRYG
ncbi:GMP synthase (glutamine-hydrolyzing) [Roseovarius sp. MBR-79]